MFNTLRASRLVTLRAATQTRATPAKPMRLTMARFYSSEDKRPNQFTMGQGSGSGKGRKKKGSGLIFGFHPFAIFASLTILGSGYTLIIKPFLQWNDELKSKREGKGEGEGEGESKGESKGEGGEKAQVVAAYSDKEIAEFPFDKKTVVFVLGGPGSGKGTNSAKLVEDFGFVHLSAGDLLREEQRRPVSQYGELIAHYIKEGLIVPHEITIGLLRNAMMDHPESDRFLIDGFPRNLEQAKAFEDTVCKAQKVLYFECPEAVLLERLLNRGKTSGRTDDNIESIKKRFRTYVNDSKPVIDAFDAQGKVITVSCQGTMDSVYETTKQKMASIFAADSASKK
ncbi:bifunctional uridylate/adenylate kinase [Coemansia sp. Benny D115]|nr:bifunctional uridylate/adenylate kinase [Coemansia sp. Benny D115]